MVDHPNHIRASFPSFIVQGIYLWYIYHLTLFYLGVYSLGVLHRAVRPVRKQDSRAQRLSRPCISFLHGLPFFLFWPQYQRLRWTQGHILTNISELDFLLRGSPRSTQIYVSKLVREALHERRIFLQTAPYLSQMRNRSFLECDAISWQPLTWTYRSTLLWCTYHPPELLFAAQD